MRDCNQRFLTYHKARGYCCDFHENMMGYLQTDVWHLFNPRLFRFDFGFELEQLKIDMSYMKKAVDEGNEIIYDFYWYTKTTERDMDLKKRLLV